MAENSYVTLLYYATQLVLSLSIYIYVYPSHSLSLSLCFSLVYITVNILGHFRASSLLLGILLFSIYILWSLLSLKLQLETA